jgi:hypothetical protein
VQTGRNWSACFGLAQPLGLVAHLSGDRGGRSGTATLVAARSDSGGARRRGVARRVRGARAEGWWTHFGVAGRKKLTKRTSSMARCGRPEGNGGGGGIWGGGRQLAVRGGCTRRRGAWGVVESV